MTLAVDGANLTPKQNDVIVCASSYLLLLSIIEYFGCVYCTNTVKLSNTIHIVRKHYILNDNIITRRVPLGKLL